MSGCCVLLVLVCKCRHWACFCLLWLYIIIWYWSPDAVRADEATILRHFDQRRICSNGVDKWSESATFSGNQDNADNSKRTSERKPVSWAGGVGSFVWGGFCLVSKKCISHRLLFAVITLPARRRISVTDTLRSNTFRFLAAENLP